MELNLRSNNTSFTSHITYDTRKEAAEPQARPIQSLVNTPDLSTNPFASNLKDYHTTHPIAEATDRFSLPDYQPIKPGESYMEKLADEAMNSKKMNIWLKNAQENEELGDFKDAEKAYKKALKYTDNPQHYKLYAACLKEIYLTLSSAPSKDKATERIYKEKAAKSFYYLGELYEKDAALKEAQAAYKASCELAVYEAPLQALVEVARQLKDSTESASALEKLADFYSEKGAIAVAIEKLKEVFEMGKSPKILEKLEVLYRKEGGEDALEKLADFYAEKGAITLAIERLKEVFEMGKSPKILEKLEVLYRKEGGEDALEKLADFYTEKGAIALAIERLEEAFQVLKSVTILEKLEVLYNQAGGEDRQAQVNKATIHRFELQLSEDPKNIGLYRDYAWFLKSIGRQNEARAMKKRIDGVLQTLQQKLVKQKTKIGDLKQTIDSQAETIYHLKAKVQTDASKNDAAIGGLQTRIASVENIKFSEQINKLNIVIAQHLALKEKVEFLEKGVSHLDLRMENDIQDADLIFLLRKNPNIQSLNFSGCRLVTDEAFRHIGKCTQLTSLTFSGCKLVTDEAFRHIRKCTQLTSLTFSGCNQVTDEAFEYIETCTQLTSLTFSNCIKVTDEAFRHIRKCTRLASLAFSGCNQVTNEAFRHIKKCTQLTSITLRGCNNITRYATWELETQGITIAN